MKISSFSLCVCVLAAPLRPIEPLRQVSTSTFASGIRSRLAAQTSAFLIAASEGCAFVYRQRARAREFITGKVLTKEHFRPLEQFRAQLTAIILQCASRHPSLVLSATERWFAQVRFTYLRPQPDCGRLNKIAQIANQTADHLMSRRGCCSFLSAPVKSGQLLGGPRLLFKQTNSPNERREELFVPERFTFDNFGPTANGSYQFKHSLGPNGAHLVVLLLNKLTKPELGLYGEAVRVNTIGSKWLFAEQ